MSNPSLNERIGLYEEFFLTLLVVGRLFDSGEWKLSAPV